MRPRNVRPLKPSLHLGRIHRSPSSTRHFHASHARQNAVIDFSHTIIQNIHTFTGLPWAGSLFLTGALMRVAFSPVQFYGLRIQKTKQETMPLRMAHMKAVARIREVIHVGRPRSAAEGQDRLRWVKAEVAKRTKKIKDTYKVRSTWISAGLAVGFLPIWIVNAGVVQTMSGLGERGWLSFFLDPASLPPPEPALATETLLWIPSLTAPDPLYILPLSFGLLLYLSISRAATLARLNFMESLTKSVVGPRRMLVLFQYRLLQLMKVAPIFCIFFFNAPSAVLLFLCSSVSAQILLGPILRTMARLPRKQPQYWLPASMAPQVKPKYAKTAHQMDIFRPPDQHRGDAASPDSTSASARPSASGQDNWSRPVARAGVQKAGPSHHLRL